MSTMDPNDMSISDQVAQYVLELRGQGACLPYHDYEILREWLVAAGGDYERLLLIMSEVLPDYFNKPGRNVPPDLRGVRKKILKLIEASVGKAERGIRE